VTVTVNATGSITAGAATPAAPTVGQTVSIPLTYPAGAAGTSPVTSVRVDWGDGRIQSYSGQPSVITHSYGAAGGYLVVIAGQDAFGDTSTTSVSITVAPKPQMTVDISAPANATAGVPLIFTITAVPTTGNTVTSVTIDFGDGTPALTLAGSVKSVSHTYAASGTYIATAVATDSSGATGTGTTVISIGGVNASFTTTNGAAGSRSVSFNASGSTSSSQITSYAWDFGDGTTGSGVTVSGHIFPAAGAPFTVRLTVTDSAGRVAVTTQSITPP
jgi:PKD repeat protein